MSTKSVVNILSHRGGALHSLLERGQYLQQLTQALRDCLDTPLADHVTVANVRNDAVVITTDTPAWLTQLRYQAPTLLHLLKTLPSLENVQKVQFKIQPANHAPQSSPPRRASLSTTSAELLKSAATSTEDDELAESLYRLSRHAQAKKT